MKVIVHSTIERKDGKRWYPSDEPQEVAGVDPKNLEKVAAMGLVTIVEDNKKENTKK